MNDRDERLARIVDELTDGSLAKYRAARVERAVRENPDLEQKILELAATVMVADDVVLLRSGVLRALLKQSQGDSDRVVDAHDSSLPVSTTGTQIGDYELVEEIGCGGMGVIFRARHKLLGHDVALKMIRNAEFAAWDDFARLRVEALAAGQREFVGPASDVYSPGVILYAMLAGQPPYQAATPLQTMLLVPEQDPPSLRKFSPAVDVDLEIIVFKCLQKTQDFR